MTSPAPRPLEDTMAVLEAFNKGFNTQEIADHIAAATGEPCSEAEVYNLLIQARPKTPSRVIIATVAREYGVTQADILGPCRSKSIVAARHEAIRRVAKEWDFLSSPVLGRMFNRNHSTVLHALGRIARTRAIIEARLNTTSGAVAE